MTTARARRPASSAREAAFAVLTRAEAADAFVSVLLFRTLEQSVLSGADRALATAITLGVLRHRERIDYALRHCLTRPLEDLPAAIRTILRMGAYQILDLDRVPAAAATFEAVNLARRHGHVGTARLVNAVLRRLAAEGPPPLPEAHADPAGHVAIRFSHPRWLIQRWMTYWGRGEAEALAAVNTQPAPSVLRANTLRTTRDGLLEILRAHGLAAEPGLAPDAVRVHGSLTERLPAIEEGLCVPQDEAAMLVSYAVAPHAGQIVIDACAAPGGKATHLAALMGDRGRVIACDVHARKLEALAARAARLAATCVEAHHLDAREVGRKWQGQADAVLVDAPCSGLGTVRRRPEIKWRAAEADLVRLAASQRAILAGAAGAARSGGTLVYSVCSLEPEEGPGVAASFLAAHPAFERSPLPAGFPPVVNDRPIDEMEVGEARLLPHRHDTDGFYIAHFRRR